MATEAPGKLLLSEMLQQTTTALSQLDTAALQRLRFGPCRDRKKHQSSRAPAATKGNRPMGTITSLMNLAQQALLADQAGLNVTASNVANQATPGYTVETLSQQAQDTVSVGGGSYGDGVIASTPQSQRNRVLEQQVQQQMQLQSQSSAVETALDQVQNVFGISSTSASSSLTQLGTAVDGFFSSLTALASNPSDTATREGVLSAASNLANSTPPPRSSPRSAVTNALTYTTQTNATPTALALNVGTTGVDASLTVNGAAVSSPTNNVTTAIPGVTFTAVAPGTSTLQINASITGGQLGGTLQVLDQELPSVESSIDSLAYALGSAVNTQNSAGIDANGNPGADLFTLGTSATGAAATIAVTTTNPQLVAAAATVEGSSGNTNAGALAALSGTAVVGTQTADQYLSSSLANIGNAAAAATNNTTVQQAALTQLTTERDSYSTVSLDTEASNLTLYQRSYQAASQVFSIADTLMASAINIGVEVAVS